MSLLDNLAEAAVSRSKSDRVEFDAAGVYLVQTTRVEGPIISKMKKLEFFRLSFRVIEVESDPQGKALPPASEPEIAIFDDPYNRGKKVLAKFFMVSKGLGEKEAATLSSDTAMGWVNDGSLEGHVLRLEVVQNDWEKEGRTATFYNPHFRAKIDKRKLSKEAKARLL